MRGVARILGANFDARPCLAPQPLNRRPGFTNHIRRLARRNKNLTFLTPIPILPLPIGVPGRSDRIRNGDMDFEKRVLRGAERPTLVELVLNFDLVLLPNVAVNRQNPMIRAGERIDDLNLCPTLLPDGIYHLPALSDNASDDSDRAQNPVHNQLVALPLVPVVARPPPLVLAFAAAVVVVSL